MSAVAHSRDKFHPYSEIFPLLDGAQIEELAADIKANGLREALWLYQGQILDGRNRFLACDRASVEPEFREYTGDDPLGFVISLNIARRHLTVEQRALAAARITALRRGDNQHTARAASSQAQVAENLGVSVDSVQRARKVIEHGSKALQRAVESGDVGLRKAADVVGRPKPEQLAAATADSADGSAIEAEDAHIRQLEQEMSASFDKLLAADDKLAAAYNEIKRQAAEIATLKLSRDGYMNGKTEMERRLKRAQSHLDRLQSRVRELEGENEKLAERVALMQEGA